MSILVTGVTGVLGSEIGSYLHDAYFIVRGGVDNKKLPLDIDPSRVINGDITKRMLGISVDDFRKLESAKIDKFIRRYWKIPKSNG